MLNVVDTTGTWVEVITFNMCTAVRERSTEFVTVSLMVCTPAPSLRTSSVISLVLAVAIVGLSASMTHAKCRRPGTGIPRAVSVDLLAENSNNGLQLRRLAVAGPEICATGCRTSAMAVVVVMVEVVVLVVVVVVVVVVVLGVVVVVVLVVVAVVVVVLVAVLVLVVVVGIVLVVVVVAVLVVVVIVAPVVVLAVVVVVLLVVVAVVVLVVVVGIVLIVVVVVVLVVVVVVVLAEVVVAASHTAS